MLSDDAWHAQLLQLWRKFLKTEDLSIDDDFFEKGGDSLLALDLQLELQRLIGQELPESFLLEASTVRLMAKKLPPPAEVRPGPVIRTGLDDARSPLVFLHGDAAEDGALMETLVRALAPEQRVVAMALRDLNGGSRSSIEDIAAGQVPLIVQARAGGPYRLGGRREAALVALEAARLLAAAGHEVELVAMVDPTGIAVHRRPVSALLARMTGKKTWGGADVAETAYVPAPLAVPLLIFCPASEGQAWRSVSPDVEVISLPGSRSEWVTRQSAALVRYLRARLQSIGESQAGAKRAVAAVPAASNSAGGLAIGE